MRTTFRTTTQDTGSAASWWNHFISVAVPELRGGDIAIASHKEQSCQMLHFAIQVKLTFSISDIQGNPALRLSANVPECQKLEL